MPPGRVKPLERRQVARFDNLEFFPVIRCWARKSSKILGWSWAAW